VINQKQKTPNLLFMIAGCLFLILWTIPVVAQDIKRALEIERRLVPITGDDGDRGVDLDIRFGVNLAKLTDAARRQLSELGRALKSEKLAGARFEINGHTDASGNAAHNKALSLKRAIAVRDFLVKIHSVKSTRLVPHGYGEERLKNALEPNAAENRRVEIIANYERSDPPAQNEGKKKDWGTIQ
jgi:outer membrane protein OmpA-like peptidoglycan-associated protein